MFLRRVRLAAEDSTTMAAESSSTCSGIMVSMGTGTSVYKRLHGLTIEHHNAIDRLIQGETDAATAVAVGVNRVTVTKWRLYDAAFQAELNRRRKELWGTSVDRLRGLLPTALDALEEELRDGKQRWRAAIEVLRLAGLDRGRDKAASLETYLVGATDADSIIDARARARRDDPVRDLIDGDPVTEREREAVRREPEQRLLND
jgi:hypothetical protein